jgi:hypothetical protein
MAWLLSRKWKGKGRTRFALWYSRFRGAARPNAERSE